MHGYLTITSSDGLLGAVTRDGRFIVTSPNSVRMFHPPLGGDRSLFLRSNLRFGDDGELQWPQPFLPNYVHLVCIMNRPTSEDDPMEFRQCGSCLIALILLRITEC